MSAAMQPPAIPTRVAQMGNSDHEFCGHKLFGELLGHTSFTGMLALSLGVPKLAESDVQVLEALFVTAALADPRIWPLKLCRLVSSYGHSLQGHAAGLLMFENGIIGPWSMDVGARVMIDIAKEVNGAVDDVARVGEVINRVVTVTPRIPGFGVPFRKTDERMNALRALLCDHPCLKRPYWRLLMSMEAHLRETRKTEPNVNAAATALMLDMGFAPEQMAWMLVMASQSTFLATAVEGAAQKNETLRRMPDVHVTYSGPAPRVSPRAKR